jgi:hypothetical protein
VAFIWQEPCLQEVLEIKWHTEILREGVIMLVLKSSNLSPNMKLVPFLHERFPCVMAFLHDRKVDAYFKVLSRRLYLSLPNPLRSFVGPPKVWLLLLHQLHFLATKTFFFSYISTDV